MPYPAPALERRDVAVRGAHDDWYLRPPVLSRRQLDQLAPAVSINVQAPPAADDAARNARIAGVADKRRASPASAWRSSTPVSRRTPIFAGRITGLFDFTHGLDGAAVAPIDDYGHGTHVAGLIGSSGIMSNHEFQESRPPCG